MRLSVAMAIAWLSISIVSAAEPAQAVVRQSTNIPAQALGSALQALAKQRAFQVVYLSDAVDTLETQGASGDLTSDEALKQLLSGTGLSYRYLDEATVTIFPANTPQAKNGFSGTLRVAQSSASNSKNTASTQATENQNTPSPVSSENEGNKLQEIVVTAQKREERLQNVPISISVLSGRDLDRSTGEGVNEALATIPGVKITENPWNGAQVSVRGVSASQPVLGGPSPIAYYIDSVPFGFVKNALGPDTSAYDLQRVEVLRGPQGTLYGASALNGVVRILTNDANLDDFELKARTLVSDTKGGSESFRGDFAVNVPIVQGKVAARAVLGYTDSGGWIDKLNKKDVNSRELNNIRLKLNARPIDQLSVGFSAWRSRTDADAPNLSDAQDIYPGSGSVRTENDFDILGLKLVYEIAAFSISSATSYVDYTNHSTFDFTPFGSAELELINTDSKVFSQEVLLSSVGDGAWRWSAGGFYRDAKDRWAQYHSAFFPIPADFSDTSESFAVFGELTRVFLDGKFALTGGLRYFEDDVGQVDFVSGSPVPPASATFDNVSPRLVLTWHPMSQLTAYASYSEGFRSGFNQTPALLRGAPVFAPAKEDKLDNYELGLKGGLFDGRLSFDAAIYYIDWQDVQQNITVFNGVNPQGLFAVLNGESASGTGIDVAVSARPVGGLELSASLSWNDLSMDADVFSGGDLLLKKGDRLRLSAEYTAGASAGYVFPIGGRGLESRLLASANYSSELFSPRTITSSGAVSQVPAGDAIWSSKISAAIGDPNRWTAEAFVDNVSDDRGATEVSPAVPYFSTYNRPRTIGLQFEYRY